MKVKRHSEEREEERRDGGRDIRKEELKNN